MLILIISMVALFFGVYSKISKENKKNLKKIEETEEQPEEEKSFRELMEELLNDGKPATTAKKASRKAPEVDPRSLETLEPAAGRKPKKTVSAAKPNTETKPALQEADNEPKNEILDDFDARKAIIYSEILKPKFEDE